MAGTKRFVLLTAAALGMAPGPFALVAEGPPAPEPKVEATIEQSAKPNGACLVRAEVRDPKSNDVLAEPKIAVAAGQEASVSSSDADRKVEVTVKAGPACAGGTYLVNVWTAGKLAYSKSGALGPKAR
jgi:hypothetical protein